jgi:16S rRNA G966 N2-methylase RsmD
MNPSTKPAAYFSGLPPYFGGKRKLVKPIFHRLAQHIPQADWYKACFVDAFAGGGSVSLSAKAYGFGQVLSNDLSDRSRLVIRAFLENDRVRLQPEDILALATFENTSYRRIEATFAGHTFSVRHARALDQALAYIDTVQDTVKQALLRVLLWHHVVEFVAFGTSVGTSNRPFAEVLDGKRPWYELNPKRLRDNSFEKLLKPAWHALDKKRRAVNQSVFAAQGIVTGFQQDAFAFVSDVQGDILYLDPPYPGTLSYEKANAVLDRVLFGEAIPAEPSVSPFTKDLEALLELLSKAGHFPLWVISLNNKVVDLAELETRIRQVDPTRRVTGWAIDYKHLAHVSKTSHNQELLVIAEK